MRRQRRHASGVVGDDGIDPQLREIAGQSAPPLPSTPTAKRRWDRTARGSAAAVVPRSGCRSCWRCRRPSSTSVSDGPACFQDLARVSLKDGALGARQVVLGQLGDLLEQRRADVVVKQLRTADAWALRSGPRVLRRAMASDRRGYCSCLLVAIGQPYPHELPAHMGRKEVAIGGPNVRAAASRRSRRAAPSDCT